MIPTLLKLAPVLWPMFKKLLEGRGLIVDKDEERKFQIELVQLAQKEEEYFVRVLEAVNRTMQAEAKSEHWAQWLWRPIVGFTFAAIIINNYVLMPYLQNYLQPIVIPSEVWNALLMVLGVSAATRGWQKIEQARNGHREAVPVVGTPIVPPTAPEAPQWTAPTNRPREPVSTTTPGIEYPAGATTESGEETEKEREWRVAAGEEYLEKFKDRVDRRENL